MRVLYIEDDIVDQIAFKRLSRKFKEMDVQVVSSLKEAMKLMSDENFNLVLSDYFLAGETVLDVIENIKELPVFLVSGLEDLNQIKGLYDKGIQGHFLKPLTEDDLSQLMGKNCNGATKTEEVFSVEETLKQDLTCLEKLSQNSVQIKIELMEIFLAVAKKEKDSVQLNLELRNWKEIGLSVHKLKSNLRMMGYQPLLEKANEIETNCLYLKGLDSMFREIPTFVSNLEKGMELVENQLSRLKNISQ